MEKPQIFMYLGFITTILIMTLNIKAIDFYESRRMKIIQENPETSSRVCRDVFEIGRKRKNMSDLSELGVEIIYKAKKNKTFLRDLYYEVLGYEVPSMLQEVSPGQGFEGSKFAIKKEWRLQQAKGQLAYMPCRLREYGPKDVHECTVQRQKSGKRKTHLLYIGDSRIRQHIEVMIDLLRDLDLKITTYRGEILSVEDFLGEKGMKNWNKYKHNFRVESRRTPGLIIEFKWAALIDWGDEPKGIENVSYGIRRSLREEKIMYFHRNKEEKMANFSGKESGKGMSTLRNSLKSGLTNIHSQKKNTVEESFQNNSTRVGALGVLRRLNSTPQEHLPDIVFLNTGAWKLQEGYSKVLEGVDHSSVIVMTALRPLLKSLATRTTVVWVAPEPFKEHIQHDFDPNGVYTQQNNANLEWLLNAQGLLQPPNMLFWDSFLPVSFASRQDCMMLSSESVDMKHLPTYKVFEPRVAWQCWERVHIGFEALGVAVQMVLNHVCNPYLKKGYCCSKEVQ